MSPARTRPLSGADSEGSTYGHAPRASPKCVVPNVKGKTLAAAKRALVAKRCRVGTISRAFSKSAKLGRVISQAPVRGTRPNGTRVNLKISRGRKR